MEKKSSILTQYSLRTMVCKGKKSQDLWGLQFSRSDTALFGILTGNSLPVKLLCLKRIGEKKRKKKMEKKKSMATALKRQTECLSLQPHTFYFLPLFLNLMLRVWKKYQVFLLQIKCRDSPKRCFLGGSKFIVTALKPCLVVYMSSSSPPHLPLPPPSTIVKTFC